MHRTTFQATSVVFFLVVNWSKVGPYAWLGQWNADNLSTSLVLLPLAPVGISLGRRLHDHVNDVPFFRVVHASLFVIGVRLLHDAWAVVWASRRGLTLRRTDERPEARIQRLGP